MNAASAGLQFFTPSYAGDLERFVLLRQTVRHFARCAVAHVVAVPRRDVHSFRRALADDTATRVLAQEDFVSPIFYAPAWSRRLQRVLGKRAWRLERSRFGGRPGWIVQQIVKLSAPEVFQTGAVCLVDSDLLFIRPFAHDDLVPTSGPRILMRKEPDDVTAQHPSHMRRSREILGLPPGSERHHFMESPGIWYVDWVRALRTEIEHRQGKPWQRVLYDAGVFSEYLLYGIFVDEILRPPQLRQRTAPFSVGIWNRGDFDRFVRDPQALLRQAAECERPLSLVVQSNIGVEAAAYSAIVRAALLGSAAE